MKVTATLACIAIASTGLAQALPPETELEHEAYWYLFMPPRSTGHASQSFAESGMSQEGVQELALYVHRSWKDIERQWAAQSADLCAHLDEFKKSRDAFADKVARDEADYLALQRTLIANIGVVLNAQDEAKLRAWVVTLDLPTKAEMPAPLVDMIRHGGLYNPAEDMVCEDGKPRQVNRSQEDPSE